MRFKNYLLNEFTVSDVQLAMKKSGKYNSKAIEKLKHLSSDSRHRGNITRRDLESVGLGKLFVDMRAGIKEDINEMGGEIDLEAGYVITKKVMRKMKKKYKTYDEFIKHLDSKASSLHSELTKKDHERVKAAYDSI